MSQKLEELITRQEATFCEIKKQCTNYKKDSSDRKTREYLEKRLTALNASWEQFAKNHLALKDAGCVDIQYFQDDVFEKTKEVYEEVSQDIIRRRATILASMEKAKATPKTPVKATGSFDFSDVEFQVPPPQHGEFDAKHQDLMRQQFCNFRAFERTVEKIDLGFVTEKWELEDNLHLLKIKWDHIEKVNWELDYILQEDDANYKQKYLSVERIYDSLRRQLHSKIWNSAHYEKATPKIIIPDFYGNYSQWNTFRDLYVASVHDNPLLSSAQKMQHLKSKLKGEAEKLVQHLGISAENYTSCWELITHRYDNKRLLFTAYMNTLLNQPTIQQASAISIKKIHDVMLECLNGLKNIGLDITTWDPIIVFLLVQKLDTETFNEYMKDLKEPRDLPDLEEFTKFLENKFMALEAMQSSSNQKTSQVYKYQPQNKPQKPINFQPTRNNNFMHKTYNTARSSHFGKAQTMQNAFATTTRKCPICKTDHVLMQCDKFLLMSATGRRDTVNNLRLCKNCLFSHGDKQCLSERRCKLCNKNHHTLMHEAEAPTRPANASASASTSRAVNNVMNTDKEVLLPTVLLKVKTVDGNYINLRGLLDQGSQVSLVTEDAAQRLRLPRKRGSAVVSGVGALSGNCKGSLQLECKSIHSDYQFQVETLVMKKLINKLPTTSFRKENWHYLENLKLADPQFNVAGPVDLLLGADIYSELILDGVLRGEQNEYPVAQQTRVGWILCGNVKTFNCLVTLNDLESISRFWETEEIAETRALPTDMEICEKHFIENTTRLPDGKYVVAMPMKPDYESHIGDTKRQALAQYLQLERKMSRNERFASEYKNFINEYIAMGHMKPMPKETKTNKQVFLSHHGVERAESTTTKLRVVFNGSYKAANGYSLNDLMYTGPNLQKDILTLIINWRAYKYVFCADLEKMYRQIWLNENQQRLQKILWRDSPHQPLQEWQLCTVTYGMKSAPYLAMRTLHQLAQDEREQNPEAAEVLRSYFYMDDLVHGSDTVAAAKSLVADLIKLLKKGGFNLRKWKSNEPAILEELSDEQKCKLSTVTFNPEQTANTKTLGISWNPASDTFTYNWHKTEYKNLTKRAFLAEISKLYDPLGWLSPVTIKTKLLFQKVWLSNTEWDENLPLEVAREWESLREDLPNINKLSIPRWINCSKKQVEIHGFSDASPNAYACAIYSRVKTADNKYVTTLIAAKTKVAPLKNKLTLPKMELCGALLLAKLVEKVKTTLNNKELEIYCWSDSQVVLAWLQGNINKWERFVANRVTQINNIIPPTQWRYVKSEHNAADCATRGLLPSNLLTFNLWWEGPDWLKDNTFDLLKNNFEKHITTNGIKKSCCITQIDNACEITNMLLNKVSSLKRVIRILAWIRRFSPVYRKQNNTIDANGYLTNCDNKERVMTLTAQELVEATELLIKKVQKEYYSEDMDHLKKTGSVPTKSSLLKLTPFIDENGILRARGRLANSLLPPESKHPMILPATGRLTELIIQESHRETLHGGARLTLAHIRLKFWIIGGRQSVNKQLRRCVRCHRYKPHKNEQLMADLPKERVLPSRPFTNTGVDFTGHVEVKINKGRGVKTCKAYIAIFICMVTKALHLELVSDLTTLTFLAAFKRMCARRGTPKHVYSDNGTNFVGAANLLQKDFELHQTFNSSEFQDEMSNHQIQWHFNAPLWPTAAGLWESAVKSMKYHLKRVLGEHKLTFEQFTTLLTQIEACLNSRPLCPLTEDIDDLEYLTPGHFLVGGPLLSLPQEEEDFNEFDLRNRWRLIEQLNIRIWKRWSSEYLHQLQERCKWQTPKKNLEKGNLVLIKEENLSPGKWALGRILEVHPGADGNVRVVTVRTKGGQLKRPITKLAPLPLEENLKTTDPATNKKKTEMLEQHNTSRSRFNGKTTFSLFSILMVMMISLLGTASSAQLSNYKMTTIDNNHPIYFDEAGKLQLIHDEWTLLVYYNLTSYWKATNKLQNYINQIDGLCQKTTYTPCTTIVSHLRHELRHVTEYNTLLLSQHLTRRKRGYFDGIGKLARTLFGVLDEDFAVKYENDIEMLQSNDKYLLQLMKNQTLIIEAENNVIKKSEAFMNEQLKTINTYLEQTHAEITKIESRVQMLYAINDINTGAIISTLILNNLQRIQEILLDALADVYKGHLDTHLFPASQLASQLNIISGKLPKGLSLPVKDVQEDIQDIYELIYVKARITTNYLLFELHIPLLSDDEYTIYRVIPIPFRRQERLKMVEPSSEYIAINFIKKTYTGISETDVKQCTKYSKDKFSCIARQPVYNLYDTNAPCEAKVFGQQTSLSCVIKDVRCKELWTSLHNPNVWLFTLCEKQLIRIICKDQVTPIALDGTGVITMKPQCILQKKDATIYTYNHLGSQINIGTDIDVPTIDSAINNMFNLSWSNSHLNITERRADAVTDLNKVEEQLHLQKAQEKLPPTLTSSMSVHDIHHYTVTTLLLGGILLTVFGLVIRKRCYRKTAPAVTETDPTPQDRRVVNMQMEVLSNAEQLREPVYSEPRFNFD